MRDVCPGSLCLVDWTAKLHWLLALAIVVGISGIMLSPPPAEAATLPSITYTGDCPDYSQFINDVASAGAGQSLTITFTTGLSCDYGVALTQTLTVKSGATVTIVGNGLTIYGGGQSINLIDVSSHASLNLSGTTLSDANNGIDASSTAGAVITLSNCVITGNAIDGINANNATDVAIAADHTTFSTNVNNGISVADADSPTIAVTQDEIESDGFYAVNVNTSSNPAVTIEGSYIHNAAGGIAASDTSNAAIVIGASTFYSLDTMLNGFSMSNSTISITNSTITENSKGIAVQESSGLTLGITSSTITDNTNYGIYTQDATGTSVTLTASILADNTPASCFEPVTDGGYNRSTDDSCDLTASTSRVVSTSSLNLQLLSFNGGPTPTIALGQGSVAIDQIPLNFDGTCSAGEQTDQRGVARPQGLACDIGAYEAPGTLTFLPGDTYVVHQGYWALIRIAVLDSNGHNISNRSLHLTALELDGAGQSIPFVHALQFGTFNGRPGYQISINTRNLSPGSWQLVVRIGSNPTATIVPFMVE